MNSFKERVKYNFKNKYNCIPLGFNRFTRILPGLIKGTYYCITGPKDSGKTKFLTYFFLMNTVDFVKKVNDTKQVDIVIFLYCLKTKKDVFHANILSALLKRKYNLEIDYLQLMSIPDQKDRKLSQDVLDKIDSLDPWFEYFYSKVHIFDNLKTPSQIFKNTKKLLADYGQMNADDKFVYDNPNLFVVNAADSINFLQSEMDANSKLGMDLTKCMDKHSCTNMLELKDVYDCAIVDIHDQAIDKEKMEWDFSGKSNEEKLEPSADGLGNNKTNQRIYDFLIGLHYPWKYKHEEHKFYLTNLFKDNYRSLKVIANTFGVPNHYLGMWFDGAACTFEELPPSKELSDVKGIEQTPSVIKTKQYIKLKQNA